MQVSSHSRELAEALHLIAHGTGDEKVRFIAESSLSLLSEPHILRMKRNGFIGLLPGIESWYELGNKSKTGANTGLDKVRHVADQVYAARHAEIRRHSAQALLVGSLAGDGQMQRRTVGKRACHGNALHFAARKLARQAVGTIREPDGVEYSS